MNKYTIYKDGKLIKSDLTRRQAIKVMHVGMDTFDRANYGRQDKEYPLDINGYKLHVEHIEKSSPTRFPPKLIKEWDDMTIAAEMIRQGRGKIVVKRIDGEYRRVTVPR